MIIKYGHINNIFIKSFLQIFMPGDLGVRTWCYFSDQPENLQKHVFFILNAREVGAQIDALQMSSI
jgi:hypothetical protein